MTDDLIEKLESENERLRRLLGECGDVFEEMDSITWNEESGWQSSSYSEVAERVYKTIREVAERVYKTIREKIRPFPPCKNGMHSWCGYDDPSIGGAEETKDLGYCQCGAKCKFNEDGSITVTKELG